jgi:hypothetical protein
MPRTRLASGGPRLAAGSLEPNHRSCSGGAEGATLSVSSGRLSTRSPHRPIEIRTVSLYSPLGAALLAIAVTSGASAQVPDSGARQAAQDPKPIETRAERPAAAEERCEGCPRRRPLLAVGEVAAINVFYNLFNRLIPTEYSDDFRVSPETWAANIGHGFSWDNDPFVINQFGHPYMGGNYFSAGRSNGLSYWESLPLTLLGSVTWEWLGETNRPAWNDVINTTIGGAAFGEVLGRIAWLVRDPRQSGRARLWREIGATVIDPIGGLNRFASRDALRPGDTPVAYQTDRAAAEIEFGASWQEGDLRSDASVPRNAFGSFALEYGALEQGPSRAPFDAFTMAVRVGGGAMVSAASIRGRLASRSIGGGDTSPHRLLIAQDYGYRETPGYLFGEQTILGGLVDRFELGTGVSVATSALAGAIVLGTIDSPAASEEDRTFDYGPGVAASGSATLTVRGVPVIGVTASVWWMHTVTRKPADHLLSLVRVGGRIPVTRAVHVLVEAERTTRATSAQPGYRLDATYPELRAGLAWRFGR